MTSRSVLLLLVALASLGWLLAPPGGESDSVAAAAEPGDAQARVLPVRVTVAVAQSSYERVRHFTGAFVAARESRLAFERTGRIVRLLVDEGDEVAAGQPMAELDRRHLNAERSRVEAQLTEADALLGELVAGPRKETIAAAEAQVRNLTALRDLAEQNLLRSRQLVESRAVSQQEYDDDFYQYRARQAQVDSAQKELDELLAGTRKEQIAAQRARVAQLRAELADIGHDLEDTTLRAPFDGVVAERLLDEGAIAAVGAAVFRVLDRRPPELWVGMPASVAARLKVGAAMRADAGGEPLALRVRSLRAELDETTRTRNVVFEISPDDGPPGVMPVPGQIGRVASTESVSAAGFWVPTDSLTPRKRGLWAVYVVAGEGETRTVAARDVEVISNDGDRSFVRGALTAGEAIIATGAHRLVEGQRVTIAP